MGRTPANEQPLSFDQVEALRELIEATAAETVAVDRARRALVAAHTAGISWTNLGIALNCSRETARSRVKVAQKHVAEVVVNHHDDPVPAAPAAVTVSGPMPAGVN